MTRTPDRRARRGRVLVGGGWKRCSTRNEPREYLASPTSPDLIATGQVFAWNPSVAGAKSEDSVAIGEADNEALTEIPGWPTVTVEVGGRTWQRPAVREVG